MRLRGVQHLLRRISEIAVPSPEEDKDEAKDAGKVVETMRGLLGD